MSIPALPLLRAVAAGVVALVLVGISCAMPLVKNWLQPTAGEPRSAAPQEDTTSLRLVDPDTLAVTPDVIKSLGVRTVEARPATKPRPLPPLAGSLALDADRMTRVHARFPGEIVQIGTTAQPETAGAAWQPTVLRPLRFGDKVEKDQLLAVLWSKDLGEKKSELVDALSKLWLDQHTLERLEELLKKGATTERNVREAERNVQADLIAVERAERTLRSWRLTEAELEALRTEAERLAGQRGRRERKKEDADWARVQVKAPFDGTILEKNVALGDIVDTTTDLFKIADLSRLNVLANAYEEDLPILESLPRPIPWTVRVKNPHAEPLRGTVTKIGDIIDPNQHTALVMGKVDNPRGELRVGQYITATIEVPPAPEEVEIPTSALVEDGRESIVFVQPDPKQFAYQMRRVTVIRRYHDSVYLQGRARGDTPPEASASERPSQPVKPGERVVSAGAVELKAALEDLRATALMEKK